MGGINLLAQRVETPSYPSLSKAVAFGENVRGKRAQNLLAEKRLGTYEEDREMDIEAQEADKMFKVMNAISKIPNKEEKQALWDKVYPGEEMPGTAPGFYSAFVGGKLLTATGDPEQVRQFSNFLANQGSKLTKDSLPGVFNAANKAGIQLKFTNWDEAGKRTIAQELELYEGKKKLDVEYPKPDKPASLSAAELTRRALKGDEEAKAILESLQEQKVAVAKAGIEAKFEGMDFPATARSILDGRETIEHVKNVFGVAVQEKVRALVLAEDPEFNFIKPRIKLVAIKQSLGMQQKQRGAMGSFVKNINKQLKRVEEITTDVISRVGLRALDLPIRELNIRFKGSGHEKALDAYLKEISAEIAKLSQGSAQSIAMLAEDNRKEWEKIHDPSLSFKQLKIILDETGKMANMRLESVDEEMEETLNMLDNIREPRATGKPEKDYPEPTKNMSPTVAKQIFEEAGRDAAKATEIARSRGYIIEE